MKSSYYLPPEWFPQSGVMLSWPHQKTDWEPMLDRVEPVYLAITQALIPHVKVLITCFDADHLAHVKAQLKQHNIPTAAIRFYIVPTNDTWVRDNGPITILKDKKPHLLDFIFNAWGGKYEAAQDNALTSSLHLQGAFGETSIEPINLVLEGGSIEVDGEGSLLTTKRCLLSQTRNIDFGPKQLEESLQQLLGIKQVLWLEHGNLAGDDTDSHIDTLARFINSHTICYVQCDDPSDSHYLPLKAMADQLAGFKNCRGEPYRLVPLPWPKAKYAADGKRLPATYANFLITNGVVLVPTYNDPADAQALEQIQKCMPHHKIIGIPCEALIEQYGSLHCATMQLPQGVMR